MERIAPKTTLVDLDYLGQAHLIGCCAVESSAGAVLIDPGPASALATLKAKLAQLGVGVGDLHAILLTHIHLDHAGATGSLVRQNPRLRVFVHERGAKHLADPSRLLESARRLYGEEMDRFWGEVLAVPPENLTALAGGERLGFGELRFEVAYTPGHAWHHVSYLDASAGIAYVGDTGGVRIANASYVLPVTPPPDIELESWERSIRTILAWQPERLLPTHFGPAGPVREHLEELRGRLHGWSERVRRSLEDTNSDTARAAEFVREVGQELKQRVREDEAVLYDWGAGPEMSWHGLARFWRKRLEAR